MSKYTPPAFEINLGADGFVFEVGSLFEVFAGLHDGRDARGVRYALTTILERPRRSRKDMAASRNAC